MTLQEKAEILMQKVFGGAHHVRSYKDKGWYIEINTFGNSLSSFDFANLTRLVVLAHDLCMRIELNPLPGRFKILLHDRDREGDITKRHPTMEDAIKNIRAE